MINKISQTAAMCWGNSVGYNSVWVQLFIFIQALKQIADTVYLIIKYRGKIM